MITAFRKRERNDEGMTMVELLITSAVLVVLLGMVLMSMNLIDSLDSSVTAQYQEFDQVIPALAPLRTLVAAEVEPAPTNAGVPLPATPDPNGAQAPAPGFQSIGNFSATWTTNVGSSGRAIAPSCARRGRPRWWPGSTTPTTTRSTRRPQGSTTPRAPPRVPAAFRCVCTCPR